MIPEPGQLGQRVGDPGVPLQRREPRHDRQPQRGPGQRATEGDGVVAELRGHVAGDPLVGGRGGGQHRGVRRQGQQGPGQPLVVGPEVEAPVRDAVGLVDHQQPAGGEQIRQPAGEPGVGQSLRGDQQDVDQPLPEVGQHRVPLVDVGRVDGGRPQPRPLGRGDLIAHQGQQRRDHQGRTAAVGAQGGGRRPVDRRLAPAGGLHDQHPAPVVDQLGHRPQLVLARSRLRAGHRGDGPAEGVLAGEGEGACRLPCRHSALPHRHDPPSGLGSRWSATGAPGARRVLGATPCDLRPVPSAVGRARLRAGTPRQQVTARREEHT